MLSPLAESRIANIKFVRNSLCFLSFSDRTKSGRKIVKNAQLRSFFLCISLLNSQVQSNE